MRMASEEDRALISLNSASLRIFLALSAVSDHSRTMQLLFSLCNDFDRFTRLVYSFADKGLSISCSTNINVVSNEGIGEVSIDFGKAFTAPMKDDPACRSMQIYLTNEQPDLSLIELILSQKGMICEKLEEADLIACVQIELEEFSERHPRKVVIDESELISRLKEHLGINQLRAIVDPYQTPVPQLPDHLRPCWAKLRKRCVTSIDAGLDLFSEVVSTDPLAGDALLDQVGVKDGNLIPGQRFELADRRTHPYSHYALLGILSRSPTGSRGELLRMGIKTLNNLQWYVDNSEREIITLPELKGFACLQEAVLSIMEAPASEKASKLSERWQSLTQLKKLNIRHEKQSQINIDYLDAPLLEELTLKGAGFTHISGIRECALLKALDIADTDIADLGPVSTLYKSLRKLDISRTKIGSLVTLDKYKVLEELEMSHCPNLRSFGGLLETRIQSRAFKVDGTQIASLEEMPILNSESADFSSLSIRDLTGIGRSTNLKQLRLADCKSLSNIEELEQLKSLEELEISDCPELLNYTVLGRLPALRAVDIRTGSAENIALPSGWPGSLCELRIAGNTNIIGDLPSPFAGTLDLTSVTGLTKLDSLRSCSQIEIIKIRHSVIHEINDLKPLSNCVNLWINIEMEGESCLYDSVIKSLSNLPSLRLRLDGYVGINLTPLVNLANLKALVLDRSRLVTKAELQPVLGMNALEYLHFAPGSVTELGGCTFATAGKIAKLKLQLMTL